MSLEDPFKRPYPDENYVPPDEADLRRQALQRAYEIAQSITTEQARAAQAEASRPPVDRGPLLRALNAALAVGVAAWLFLAPPSWLPHSGTDRRSIERRELSLRVVLAMEAARVTAYRDAEGVLPATLAGERNAPVVAAAPELDEPTVDRLSLILVLLFSSAVMRAMKDYFELTGDDAADRVGWAAEVLIRGARSDPQEE